MKKIHPTAHWEPAKGTSLQASDYCKKEDADPYEKGTPPSPGKRNDLLEIANAVKQGMDLSSAAEICPATYIRNYRGIAQYRSLQCKPYEHDKVRGIWLHGPSGTGKSHHARLFADNFKGMYSKPQSKWFDGYAQEEVILLDDMDSDVLAHYLKIWTDKYACTGEVKGGTVNLSHKWFIITSNESIEELFKDKPRVMVEAIDRRFVEIEVYRQTESIDKLTELV